MVQRLVTFLVGAIVSSLAMTVILGASEPQRSAPQSGTHLTGQSRGSVDALLEARQ